MAKFFVGQRVRIVSCKNPRMVHMVGQEGVITGISSAHISHYYVSGAEKNADGDRCSWASWRLEPAIDPYQPCESEFKESLDRILEKCNA